MWMKAENLVEKFQCGYTTTCLLPKHNMYSNVESVLHLHVRRFLFVFLSVFLSFKLITTSIGSYHPITFDKSLKKIPIKKWFTINTEISNKFVTSFSLEFIRKLWILFWFLCYSLFFVVKIHNKSFFYRKVAHNTRLNATNHQEQLKTKTSCTYTYSRATIFIIYLCF